MYYALLLVFVLEYLRPETYLPFLKSSFFLPFGLFVISVLSNKNNKPLNTDILYQKNSKSLFIYLFLIAISAATADVTFYVWNYLTAVIGYFMIYFLIAKEITDFKRLKGIFTTLICLHIITLTLNPDLLLHPETRSYLSGGVFLGDGNDFAWSVCIVLPFSVFFYLNETNRIRKLVSLIAFVILTLSIVGTQSRGGMFALASLLMYQWYKSKNKIFASTAIALIVIIVLLFAPGAFFERMSTVKNYETEGSAQARIQAWKSAIRMAVDHPFLGVGANHFSVQFGRNYRPPGIGPTEMKWLNAHSIYFKVLGEFGFPGLFLLLFMIFSNYRSNERMIYFFSARKDAESQQFRTLFVCLNSSLVGFAVAGAFLSGINYPHLFVLSGLFTASNLIVKKHHLEVATSSGALRS